MTRLFRSKSCGLAGLTSGSSSHIQEQELQMHEGLKKEKKHVQNDDEEDDEEEEEEEYSEDEETNSSNFISTPLISPRGDDKQGSEGGGNGHQFAIVDVLVAALRKSLVTCSVSREDVSAMDISYPTEVRHVSHVTFDRFNGFLGLPTELEPELSRRVPSASASVFGVSPKSMQCSYDDRGNSVPTILLKMQKRLYAEGGLKAEGIFRINAENSHEENVRDQLNKGHVPLGIDVHCLAGLIKAWLRELPTGVLDSLTPEQVMHCNTEDDCTQLVKLIPPTEAAILDWAVNLMADVAQHEAYNKMNARNVAMVFAPNMTQMADPLTALIHAVQVMNFLKTLILKTIREREESAGKINLPTSCSDPPSKKNDTCAAKSYSTASCEQVAEACGPEKSTNEAATMERIESDALDKVWGFQSKSDEHEGIESISGGTAPSESKIESSENEPKDAYDSGDWLSLRKGVRRLYRHPVFQLNKPAKKTRSLGIVNTEEGGGEAWV